MTTEAPLRGRRVRLTSDVVLTPRERQIVRLLLEGCANKTIAARLGVSSQTVKNQLTTLYLKVGVTSRLELVVGAMRQPPFPAFSPLLQAVQEPRPAAQNKVSRTL